MVSHRGVTLPELLVVLSIMAVLMVIGIPSYRHHLAERDLDGAFHQVMTLLVFARENAQSHSGAQVMFTAVPGFTCVVLDAAGHQLQRFDAPAHVTIQCPSGNLSYIYKANGTVSPGGTFVVGSTAVSDTDQFTLNTQTGGIVAP